MRGGARGAEGLEQTGSKPTASMRGATIITAGSQAKANSMLGTAGDGHSGKAFRFVFTRISQQERSSCAKCGSPSAPRCTRTTQQGIRISADAASLPWSLPSSCRIGCIGSPVIRQTSVTVAVAAGSMVAPARMQSAVRNASRRRFILVSNTDTCSHWFRTGPLTKRITEYVKKCSAPRNQLHLCTNIEREPTVQ